ncbi:MAG: restriction endonuclease [Chloroflexi bacterium]|nr:restriction endonuclease [Chloroflexota bacterium]
MTERYAPPMHITLTEYQPTYLPPPTLSQAEGEQLWRRFDANGRKLHIAFPSPKTNHQWELISQGWVGHIPFSKTIQLHLLPKIQLKNLFGMWEYAYQIQQIEIQDALIDVQALPEFFDRLAAILANKVLRRSHQGFYHQYMSEKAQLPYVRGRVDFSNVFTNTAVSLPCTFDQHSMDIPDNQILRFTLNQIAHTGYCQPHTQHLIRHAYHALSGVSKRPFTPTDCVNRTYTRLHEDYRPMHALCRFFLEHIGPTHQRGQHAISPFLINMARLFELFVAEWLQKHLPHPWYVKSQERVTIGTNNELQFDIDLVLYDGNGRSTVVLDTKYKNPGKPSHADINQIITYAKAKNCTQAILIYPTPLTQPLHVKIGDIMLRSLTFALDDQLNNAGNQFLTQLLPSNNK